jgi:ABC-type sugar transport system permease subunit
MTEKTRFAYLLAFPAVVMVLLIVMYPLLNGIWLSFHDRYLLSPNMPFVGLKNYITLTNDQEFIKSFSITIVWVILATLIQFVVGMAIALLLHEATWGKSIFRSLILLPWAIPTIVSAILWRWMYNDLYGVINYILNSLGLINEYLPWLGATKTALIAVIIAYCWRSLPFMVLVILAGLQSISDDLYESAAIDGARNGLETC